LPNQFSINSDPRIGHVKVGAEVGLYVQDKWTYKRMTLSGGVRYDSISQNEPEITLGPSALTPDRNKTFPATTYKSFQDINPRVGVAYDVFGTGKTAVKVTLNRYVTDESLGSGQNTIIGAPAFYFQYTAARTWTDANGNFTPDCGPDGLGGGATAAYDGRASGQDFCGQRTGASANFGTATIGTTADHDAVKGFGHRGHNWEFSTSVQQELVPGRVAVDVGFFRRWFGNFTVQDDVSRSASDYSSFTVTLPTDERLPDSGKTIGPFFDAKTPGAPTNVVKLVTDSIGEQYENWQGVDVNLSARLGGGALVQGGFSTGRTAQDNCAVLKTIPEGGITTQQGLSNGLLAIAGTVATPYCHQETPYLTQVKALATYTIPRIDVQVAGTFQSLPGPQITASQSVNCGAGTAIASQLGRNCTVSGGSFTIQYVAPGDLYADRLNQVDLRVGKIFRFGGTRRLSANIDLFNVLNSSAVLGQSNSYSSFAVPDRIVPARFVKFSGTVQF
jgi:hypothetical protein